MLTIDSPAVRVIGLQTAHLARAAAVVVRGVDEPRDRGGGLAEDLIAAGRQPHPAVRCTGGVGVGGVGVGVGVGVGGYGGCWGVLLYGYGLMFGRLCCDLYVMVGGRRPCFLNVLLMILIDDWL